MSIETKEKLVNVDSIKKLHEYYKKKYVSQDKIDEIKENDIKNINEKISNLDKNYNELFKNAFSTNIILEAEGSEIVLTDATELPFVSASIKGNPITTLSGKNLMGSDDFNDWNFTSNIRAIDSGYWKIVDNNLRNIPENTLQWRSVTPNKQTPYSFVVGKRITLSFKMRRVSGDFANGRVIAYFYNSKVEGSNERTKYTTGISINDTSDTGRSTTWKTVSKTITLTNSIFTAGTGEIDQNGYFGIQLYAYTLNEYEFKDFQLEIGDIATDYVPWLEPQIANNDDLLGLVPHRGYTRISNSSNANMKIKYIADTKAYIDKKITEVAAAIVATT